MKESKKPSRPEKVLVVDDHLDSMNLLLNILTIQGYEVEQCSQGDSVLELVEEKAPDIILMDICMPEMNGLEVCQRLKANSDTQDIPIIFISALGETDSKLQAFKCGGNDYITKPFQIDEVVARVNNQLQNSRLKFKLKAQNVLLEQELLKRQLIEKKLLALNQRLNKLAAIDGLTQIANRRTFDECLTKEWQRGQRERHPLAVILGDIDYFKLYNDSLGHQPGDNCLKQVAQAISSVVKRPADLVARYGGEEFAIILPQTIGENALQLAETIRLQVKELCLLHPQSAVSDYVSLSLGVACLIPQTKYTKQQLVVAADEALYQAKKLGRDRAILAAIK